MRRKIQKGSERKNRKLGEIRDVDTLGKANRQEEKMRDSKGQWEVVRKVRDKETQGQREIFRAIKWQSEEEKYMDTHRKTEWEMENHIYKERERERKRETERERKYCNLWT